ncbi:hypothetical protein HY792_01390 [Candidatus Desantisbacteria bacterium]|nr:hypothetical protein [Candidatus Desantisbacteria bacterium]
MNEEITNQMEAIGQDVIRRIEELKQRISMRLNETCARQMSYDYDLEAKKAA